MNNRYRDEYSYRSDQNFRNNPDFQSRSGGRDYKRYEDYGENDFAHDFDGERIDFEDYPNDRFKGVGPKGYRRSDERIKEDVCDYLMQAPHVDCSEIEVSVNEGVVTLKGTVEERQMKRMAEETIEYVPGVHDVRNKIRVQARGRGGEKNVHLRQSQRPEK